MLLENAITKLNKAGYRTQVSHHETNLDCYSKASGRLAAVVIITNGCRVDDLEVNYISSEANYLAA